ncbi:hypothetical protein GCM10007338_16350 [Corynebacterium pelargi]|nr:hypothetical protein GCM10007338_16350 [Corynebacterium pelargi]
MLQNIRMWAVACIEQKRNAAEASCNLGGAMSAAWHPHQGQAVSIRLSPKAQAPCR